MLTVLTIFTSQIKETLEVLNLLIFFLRCWLKYSLKLLFFNMLPLHCKHDLCTLQYLDQLLSLFFVLTFFHSKLLFFIFCYSLLKRGDLFVLVLLNQQLIKCVKPKANKKFKKLNSFYVFSIHFFNSIQKFNKICFCAQR